MTNAQRLDLPEMSEILKSFCFCNDCLPANHVSSFVDVGHTIEEAFNACQLLTHDRLGIVSIVQILGHIYKTIYLL
jgi:hypothetical protein